MFSYGIVSVVLQRGCDFYEGVRAGKSLQNMETKVEHGGKEKLKEQFTHISFSLSWLSVCFQCWSTRIRVRSGARPRWRRFLIRWWISASPRWETKIWLSEARQLQTHTEKAFAKLHVLTSLYGMWEDSGAEDKRESYFMTNMDHIPHNSMTF